MKLYFFEGSILRSQKGFFISGKGSEKFDVPVPYFLIEHEKGYVLFDSGHNYRTIKESREFLGDAIYNAYDPYMTEDGYVLNNLKRAGVSPSDIKYVICSHLHFDHTGGIGEFPNAKYIVQRQELHYAYVPDNFMKAAYMREDFDKDLNWVLLEGWQDNKYDVFDDGKLIIYFTPGHTPGHQSLLVNLEKDGSMMLTADACYTDENLEKYLLSGLSCDNSAYIKSLKVFNEMKDRGIKIVTGHDPNSWPGYKLFPEFYE